METHNIHIGGRTYPMTLEVDEVNKVQEAARLVDRHIATLKSQYAISDRIDLMAMAALQIAAQTGSSPSKVSSPSSESSTFDWPVDRMDQLLLRIQEVLAR
ncbi:MAG: cell division protein ZapA [Bacteroidetes bacterium]|nr:cell division protein ZapA [Bacteroidota bacterium]MDA0903142.1 cell division protein ZapA [Bacteroidota bacterium]MDA1242389.1 cell division protein ZapA [Bacteroidota bacterium]